MRQSCPGLTKALKGMSLLLAFVAMSFSSTVLAQAFPSLAFDKQVVAVDAVGNGVLDAAGDVVDYALVVTNTGNITLTNVMVTDPLTGTNENIGDLVLGQTVTVDASYAIIQADLDSNGGGDGDIDNTATADSDQTDPTDDSEEVPVVPNSAPVADDDAYDATEDMLLSVSASGVLDGDIDPDGDSLTAVLISTTSNGSLDLDGDGTFTYEPDENYCGKDSFTYEANDGSLDSNTATVTITVACVNDPPEVTRVSLASQTVDYSDDIAPVTVEVTDIDDASTTLADSPVVSSMGIALSGCETDNTLSPNLAEDGSVCTFSYSGQVLSPGDNVHDIVFTASDGDGAGSVTGTHELTIEAEDATVMLDGGNDVSTEVAAPGGDSGPFSLFFSAYETDDPDFSHGPSADFGDLNNMVPYTTLMPVGPGSPVDADNCVLLAVDPDYPAGGYDQVAYFRCDFDNVPVNTYEVVAAIGGDSDTTRYYVGSDDDVFTVFDPSLGFTTGGGWFYWPGTANESLTDCGPDGYPGDKTNFGFNLKYNKKRKTAKGSVLLMRHTVDDNCLDAGSYRVKSNAIEGMSLGEGEDGDGAYGWAAVAGKSTYRELDLDNEGNHPFLMYVEDHGQQGCEQTPVDEFWIEVKDKDEVVVLQLNGPEPAGPNEATDADDEPIVCGNIVVPHKTGKGGGGPGGPNPNKPPRE